MTRAFLFKCFESFLKYENRGLVFMVNRKVQKIVRCFLFLEGFALDEPAKNLITGVSYPKKKFKCSSCLVENSSCCSILEIPTKLNYRGDVSSNKKSKFLELWLAQDYMKKTGIGRQVSKADAEYRKINEQTFLEQNNSAGNNNLIKLFKWCRVQKINHGFFKAQKSDYLHAWGKGPFVEKLIGLIYIVLMRVAKLDPPKYQSNISNLDKCLKEFQFWQTAWPTRNVRWTKGASYLLKGLHQSKGYTTDSKIDSLGTDSWKIYSLFTQLYWSFGEFIFIHCILVSICNFYSTYIYIRMTQTKTLLLNCLEN